MAAPSRRAATFAEQLYRLLLQCYPGEFRRDFAVEMVQTFRACYDEAIRQDGSRGVWRLWSIVLYDLATTVCVEHARAFLAWLKRFFLHVSDNELLAKEVGARALVTQFHLNVAQQTDIGIKRALNEDSMTSVIPEDAQVLAAKGALFVVADGLGGHSLGEVASQTAVETVRRVYYDDANADIAQALQHAVQQANEALREAKNGMGTTCVAAVLHDETLHVANVGDSRAYIVRGSEVKQVTQDHSWVAQQVRDGFLTEEQARTHEDRNLIYRALGNDTVEVDLFSEQVQEGDALVLCTDGLSAMVTDEELCTIVNQFGPQESVSHLIARANEQGGLDNITAIVVRVSHVL